MLGGGGGPRELSVPLTADMEQIDPDAVQLPKWYRPNPGRASDLAFVMFKGQGEHTRMSRITNRRWALSAFGTASAAALDENDTVYSVAPLLSPIGADDEHRRRDRRRRAAVARAQVRPHDVLGGGPPVRGDGRVLHVDARSRPGRSTARAGRAPSRDPAVHRVRDAAGLWRRVERRFSPARVLEFYAATEVGAILANVSDAKPGAMGRRLPGSAELRIAAYDVEVGGLALDPKGWAIECGVDEVGMLLARVDPREPLSSTPLRGLFSRDDAWLLTGDLFRRDADGDFWRVDGAGDVIRTADGPVFTTPIRDALSDIPAVDLAVAYGVASGEAEVAVAAVTLRAGHELHGREVGRALRSLPELERPAIVRVLPRIPVTTWFRPLTDSLREEGIPAPVQSGPAWYRDASGTPIARSPTRRGDVWSDRSRRSRLRRRKRLARIQLDHPDGAGRGGVDAELAQHALVEVFLDDHQLAVLALSEDVHWADLGRAWPRAPRRGGPIRPPRRR